MAPDSKENLMYILGIFLNYLLNHILYHLLESPHRGDSNGMPQCIEFMDSKENTSNTHQVLFLYEPLLSSAYHIGGLIFSRSFPKPPISPK